MSDMPTIVRIVEVGPRDGLQSLPNLKTMIPTENKVQYIQMLEEAGLNDIEIASFVNPKAVPQMANSVDVVQALALKSNVNYWALVPNERGLQSAVDTHIDHIAVFTAASDAFNLKNINKTVDESIGAFKPVIAIAKEKSMTVRGYVSTAFYCPYLLKENGVGKVKKEDVRRVCEQLLALGVDELSIGDTIGKATPEDVTETVSYLLETIPVEKLAMHFHDTYQHALANVEASLKLGISIFDSSAGGIGGCPFAPGATGNVDTLAVVRLMQQHNIETGVNAKKLAEAGRYINEVITSLATVPSS